MQTVNYFVTDFGTFELKTDILFRLKKDRRTKEGKLRARYEEALTVISEVAFKLDKSPSDLTFND
jgi:hypothetical protein